MRWTVLGVLVVALLNAAPTSADSSLDRAKLLYTNKLYDDAKRELVAIVASDAPAEERAQALNLLGDIAVEQGHYTRP